MTALVKSGTTAIDKLSEARALIKECKRVDDAKKLRDQAEAIRVYAKQQKESLEIQNDAAEIKLRAERRIGELLIAAKENGERADRGGDKKSKLHNATLIEPPTLADLGIEKTAAKRWQDVARLPEETFESFIKDTRAASQEVTTSGVLSLAQQQKKKAQHAEAREAVAQQARQAPAQAEVRQQAAVELLDSLSPSSVDLLLTDPPYMTDVDDIYEFAQSWVPLALSRVKPTGRIYICTGAYPTELGAYIGALMKSDFVYANILVWTYRNTLGPSPKLDYKLNWQAIHYLRGREAPDLDCPIMTEQFSVQDINAPDGRQGDRYFVWQKPDELAERFIRHSTKPGELVVDPFAGSGTFLVAAARLGRRAIGSEVADGQLELCVARGCRRA